ncbi:ribonuclease III [Pontivivens insulae]|uniref:Ribonuclease 3 n=1 Tax=Pontivivens insulae TaxID=1639689 RepID=A0A2R8ADC9_9RHOB|nr:ribonuclease III [Pontivivens insulae]RED14171.1 RNAse III [Pontivivens insulae]SPF30246.1 Ribonuclease 3 [Pontivivens insulae]
MTLKPEREALQKALGYRFRDGALLDRALTHASLSNAARPDNQRLEFLGDRVLGLIIAEALLQEDKSADEGTIAPRFNALVRKETCAAVAEKIGLGPALAMGRSEAQSGGRRKTALLGDGMEALIAAIYRDADFATARDIVLKLWAEKIASADEDARDAKTTLQEWAQAQGQRPPRYQVVERSGPDHRPTFTISATLDSGQSAQGKAHAKREAEQIAAKALLKEVTQ